MKIGIIWDALYREPVCLLQKLDEFSFQIRIMLASAGIILLLSRLPVMSGLSWGKRNIQNNGRELFSKTVE
jgi:hypothetical protein